MTAEKLLNVVLSMLLVGSILTWITMLSLIRVKADCTDYPLECELVTETNAVLGN